MYTYTYYLNVNQFTLVFEVNYIYKNIVLDHKDWRTSLKQMHEHKLMMNASIEKVKPLLVNLCNTLGETMEKVYSREQYLNSSLDNLLVEYRNTQV